MPFRHSLLLALVLMISSSLASAEIVLVKASKWLSLRDRPDTSAERLQRLQTYEPVKVLSRRGDWAQVEATSDRRGWVLSEYLSNTSFITVDIDQLNVRTGPGTDHPIKMKVGRNYPLYVINESEGWLHVMDYDGDRGWISSNLATFDNFVITQLPKSNIRKDHGTDSTVAFTAERGVVLRVLKEERGWLNVRHADGDEGWISAKIVFGWYGGDFSHTGFPKS
jgi:SH3-like domain-containing protein